MTNLQQDKKCSRTMNALQGEWVSVKDWVLMLFFSRGDRVSRASAE